MGTRERAGDTAQAQAALVGGRGGNKGSGVVVRPAAEMEKQAITISTVLDTALSTDALLCSDRDVSE